MEKFVGYAALLLVIILGSTYISREVSKNEFKQRLDEIRVVKESLEVRLNEIDENLIARDEILKEEIDQSKAVIEKLAAYRNSLKNTIEDYNKAIDSLDEELKNTKQ